ACGNPDQPPRSPALGKKDGLYSYSAPDVSPADPCNKMIPWPLKRYRVMRHAMTRGANGRRHEVDLPAAPVRVEIYSSEGRSRYSLRRIRGAPGGASALRDSQHPPLPVFNEAAGA